MTKHNTLRNIALAGAIVLSSLAADALDLPVKSINGRRYYFYEVGHGDTVYSLAKSFGISRDQIIRYNPAAADGLRAGSVLYFPYEDFAVAGAGTISHEVKKGETLYGLAHRYGVTPEEIIAANPHTKNGLKSGETVHIPVLPEMTDGATQPAHSPNETPLYVVENKVEPEPVAEQEQTPAATGGEEASAVVEAQESEPSGAGRVEEVADTIAADASIAIVLPFALGDENLSKQAQLYTDFYKGMLLAADEAGSGAGHIDIRVYDSTSLNIDDALKSASVIVAPEDGRQMADIAAQVADSAAYVLNIFNLKDEEYLSNPSIVQANIPHSAMYAKAYQGMRERFGDTRPVILGNTGGRNDKAAFIDYVREQYTSDGIVPVEISYSGTLRSSDLDILDPAERYVIVPSSGTLGEFNKMSHALKAFRDDPSTASIDIFGYPDWTAFRNDALDMLHALGATIYTRVFIDPEGEDMHALSDKFTANYGAAPMEVVPNQGALGYDVARMLIDNLRENGGIFNPESESTWRGKQSVFRFGKAAENGGYVNNALLIVTFNKDKTTQCSVL